MKSKKVLFSIIISSVLLTGCMAAATENRDISVNTESLETETDLAGEENVSSVETESSAETQLEVKAPSKEEVLAMRDVVFQEMSDSEIERVKENIKIANITLERGYFYDRLFKRLEDPEDLYWNYIEQAGEIQIGWELEEGIQYNPDSTDLTEEQFMEKFGAKVITFNRFDADNFVDLMTELRDSFHEDVIKTDFDNLIYNMQMAKENHASAYIEEIYRIVHDMDYFLFRYGPEDVGIYMEDASTVYKYYGVLNVYQ